MSDGRSKRQTWWTGALWVWMLVGVLGTAPRAHAQAPSQSTESGTDSSTERTRNSVSATSASGAAVYTLAFQGVPLKHALEDVAAQTGTPLVYDPRRVESHTVFCALVDATPEDVLGCLLNGTGLVATRSGTGTFVIRPETPEAVEPGGIGGQVVDVKTGAPLPYASVVVPGLKRGTATDEAGRFRMNRVPPGTHRVVITYIGYEASEMPVRVRAGRAASVDAGLTPSPIATDPVVVSGRQHSAPSGRLGTEAASAEQMEQVTGSGTPDLARVVGNTVGVTTRSPLADLHIQGSSTGEHEMRLDGVPVRNPVSLGRLLSAFSPLALGRITTYKAGYGVMNGSQLSGVIDVEHDLNRPDTEIARVVVDPVSANARVQIPLTIGGVNITSMAAARSSVWSVYRDPSLNTLINDWSSLDPVLSNEWLTDSGETDYADLGATRTEPTVSFYDLHWASRVELSPRHYLYASAYRGSSTLGASLLLANATGDGAVTGDRGTRVPTYDRYDWSNTVGQVRLEWLISDRLMGTLRSYVSVYDAGSTYKTGSLVESSVPASSAFSAVESQAAPNEVNDVSEAGLEGRVTMALGGRSELHASIRGTHIHSQFQIKNAFIPELRHAINTTRWAGTGKMTWGLTPYTTLELGSRFTIVPSRGAVYAEPRGAVRYDRPLPGLGDLALRLAGGVYRQFTNQFSVSRDGATAVVRNANVWLPVDASLAPPKAYHAVADALWMPSATWSVQVEGYAKLQPHLLAVNYPVLLFYGDVEGQSYNQSTFIRSSRGRAYGGGMHVEYDVPAVTATLGYSYSDARRTFPGRFNQRLEPTPWNEPHRLSLDLDVPVTSGLTLHGQGTGVWGRQWGFRQAYYDYLGVLPCPSECTLAQNILEELRRSGESIGVGRLAPYHLGSPSEHVLPPVYRFDAGVSFEHSWNGVDLRAQLRIINLLDRRNVSNWTLTPSGDETYTRSGRFLPGRRGILSLSIGY